MTAGELKKLLEDVPDDMPVEFCLGRDVGYVIRQAYIECGVFWLDENEE